MIPNGFVLWQYSAGSELSIEMPFNSFIFWFFFVIVIVLYWRLRHRAQNILLLVASYFFYGWWDWRFLFLILFSTSIDFLVGKYLGVTDDPGRRRFLVRISLIGNLSLLAFFKYLIFFTGEFSRFTGLFGNEWNPPLWVSHIVLPLGISFYTFQTLSYTLDVYRKKVEPVSNFPDYALYVAFFPQLVAGPIERSDSLLPQVLSPRTLPSSENISKGLCYILLGLFMKLFVADNVAQVVNYIFSLPTADLNATEAITASYAFAFQIYGDFAGYSYIAQGLAILLGFRFRRNFLFPYLATSPQDFWQRWHISLTSWFRDYLFMPMLPKIRLSGMKRVYLATLITWLISGVWHGANWTFIFWGVLHGGYLISQLMITRATGWEPPSEKASFLLRLPFIFLNFHLICIGEIFFRSESLDQVIGMLSSLGSSWALTPLALYGLATVAFFAIPLVAVEVWSQRKGDPLALAKLPVLPRTLAYAAIVLLIFYFPPEQTQTFIYFQF